jgi:hypothetical protein
MMAGSKVIHLNMTALQDLDCCYQDTVYPMKKQACILVKRQIPFPYKNIDDEQSTPPA